ncbi:MAG: hypothetical protein R3F07_11975 [Opitutaceae bacterium]
MNVLDPVIFFANLFCFARINGKILADEIKILEAFQKESGLPKLAFNQAFKITEKRLHTFSPTGTLGDRVKNLEYMIRYTNRSESPSQEETIAIREFSELIGLTQIQLTALIQELQADCEYRPNSVSPTRTSTNQPIRNPGRPGSKTFIRQTNIAPEIPEGIVIEFADSQSGSFLQAINIARANESYNSYMLKTKSWHRVVFPSDSSVIGPATGPFHLHKCAVSVSF